jgi:hypothetical protein
MITALLHIGMTPALGGDQLDFFSLLSVLYVALK